MKLRHIFRPRGKVATSLIGGLGNQMFQYAAGRALSEQLGCELVLDSTPLREPADHTPRSYSLDAFRILGSLDSLTPQQLHRMPVLHENHATNSWPAFVRGGTRLSGFWQSERYFENIRPQLLKEFTLSSPPSPYVAEVAQTIKQTPHAVSIHFRRGDYVTNAQAAQFHGTCSNAYYVAAMEYLHHQVNAPSLFVFSDDPQWVRAQAPLPANFHLIDSKLSSAAQDIWLMSLCRHHVIANSSFSWWGAWLGPQDGITIAPRPWFQNLKAPQEHIVPNRWIRFG